MLVRARVQVATQKWRPIGGKQASERAAARLLTNEPAQDQTGVSQPARHARACCLTSCGRQMKFVCQGGGAAIRGSQTMIERQRRSRLSRVHANALCFGASKWLWWWCTTLQANCHCITRRPKQRECSTDRLAIVLWLAKSWRSNNFCAPKAA